MLTLGLESSCDETSAAVLKNNIVLANIVRSQINLHKQYGGVVPEIASRAHLEAVDIICQQALKKANCTLSDIEGIAVTQGPGLIGALLVALNFAKGLGLAKNIKITGVNHVKAHALSPFMAEEINMAPKAEFPLVALVVSGGHTSLYLMKDYLNFETLASTRDDAAGEAFDKTAKLLGFAYPGGHIIETLAQSGNPKAFNITRPMLHNGLDFSFSGLKTRVMTIAKEEKLLELDKNSQKIKDLAASFQAAVIDVLVTKLLRACQNYKAQGAVLAGGVAANQALRKACQENLAQKNLKFYAAPLKWCGDNAAMIANLGHLQLKNNINILNMSAEAYPRWPVS